MSVSLGRSQILPRGEHKNYTYKVENGNQTAIIDTYNVSVGTNESKYRFEYDSHGNITAIYDNSDDTLRVSYVYDNLNRLARENNADLNETYVYTYDNGGNITSKKTYAYTTGAITGVTPTKTDMYDYGMDTGEPDPEDWNDRLWGYNGVEFSYDDMGNPLSYYNGAAYTFTWTQGRRLATATTGGKALSFTYNESGIRTSKIVDGEKHEYVVDGTKIISDSWTENNIKHLVTYIYDAKGVIGMAYRNNSMSAGVFEYYIFEKNLQGDIVAVYNSNGIKLVSYTYDAWGNFTPDYEPGGDSTAVIYNSFRYRGYFYDEETGLYYLNSRYYDPATGRFINADVIIPGTSGELNGYNLYAYCFNNPVNMTDSDGNWPRWITAAATTVAAGVAVVAALVSAPAVATAAAVVAVVGTVAYVAQSHHYDKRNEKNTNYPKTPKEADAWDWRNSNPKSDLNPNGGGPAADCHQFTSPDKSNVKFVSPDGRREVIFDSSGQLVLDSRDIGTYNFCPSNEVWYSKESVGHFFVDILPWAIFGNDDDDPGPLANIIVCMFE